MRTIEELTKKIIAFRDARNWKQFHNPKDVALSLVLEAGEVMELFQWKNKEEMDEYVRIHKDRISEELADVLYWVLLMSYDCGIDILESLDNKLKQNEKKYPVEKTKNNHLKYTEL